MQKQQHAGRPTTLGDTINIRDDIYSSSRDNRNIMDVKSSWTKSVGKPATVEKPATQSRNSSNIRESGNSRNFYNWNMGMGNLGMDSSRAIGTSQT